MTTQMQQPSQEAPLLVRAWRNIADLTFVDRGSEWMLLFLTKSSDVLLLAALAYEGLAAMRPDIVGKWPVWMSLFAFGVLILCPDVSAPGCFIMAREAQEAGDLAEAKRIRWSMSATISVSILSASQIAVTTYYPDAHIPGWVPASLFVLRLITITFFVIITATYSARRQRQGYVAVPTPDLLTRMQSLEEVMREQANANRQEQAITRSTLQHQREGFTTSMDIFNGQLQRMEQQFEGFTTSMEARIEAVATSIAEISSMEHFNDFNAKLQSIEAQLATLPSLTHMMGETIEQIEARFTPKVTQLVQAQPALQAITAPLPARAKLQVVPSHTKQEQPNRRQFVFDCLAEEVEMKAKDIQARATMQGFTLSESLISTYRKQFLELQSRGEVQPIEVAQ